MTQLRSRLLREAAALALFGLLATVATWPLVLDLGGRTLIGPDPMLELWAVDWASSHLLKPGLFDGNVFHPFGFGLLYADFALGTAVLLVPLRAFVDEPLVLFNLGTLLAFAFAGWSFHVLVRGLGGSLWAGLAAGVLAGFASHQQFHVYHLNLLSTGWFAWMLLGLHRLVRAPGPGWALLAGVAFSLTAQSSGYYAVIATIVALVFAAVHARHFGRRAYLVWGAVAAAVALAATAPYLHAYLTLADLVDLQRDPELSARMAFQPARDLSSHGYLYRALIGSEGERLFPGLLGLGLGAVAIARRRPHAGFYGAASLTLWLLSLGPELTLSGRSFALPYALVFSIPPFDSMRHPYTFAAVGTLLLAVLAGLGFSGMALARRAWAGPLLVALAVAETLAPPPKLREVPKGLPPAYQELMRLPPGPILEIPIFVNNDTLLWAARHGWPVANGAGAFVPPYTANLHRTIKNHWLRRVPEDVDSSKPTLLLRERFATVRYLVVPSGRRHGYWDLVEALDRSHSFRLVAEASDGDRVYEIQPP